MNTNAGDTVERISRGHFKLSIIEHGDRLQNREVQLWDVVNQVMVVGTTERAVIASMLLDHRTAAKHFTSINGKRELSKLSEPAEGGFQRVLKESPGMLVPPTNPGLGFTLRPTVPLGKRLAEAAKLDGEVVEEDETERPSRSTNNLEVPADIFTERFEFEDADAKGLFLSLAAMFGVDRVGKFLSENDPGGSLSLEWVAAMSQDLVGEHNVVVEGEDASDQNVGAAEEPGSPTVFDPAK